ncbi:MAG TPA: septal ring lytic transglycosylase RlpA family protein [Deinococcales bacterium]|nr:septal ring lytic transglycosylase RlpA family protein [Deinococcales bacterium]
MRSSGLLFILAALLFAGCAPVTRASLRMVPAVSGAVAGTADAAAAAPRQADITGNASWYGPGFAGRHTANGEVFDPGELTAAHRTLPFNTRVRVTHAGSGQNVVVRINDRGPFKGDRVIDLSRAAADAIGLTASGVAMVHLEILSGNGVVTGAPSEELTPFEVVARGRELGELLLLSAAGTETDQVMVRVVGTEVPAGAGADLLMSDGLFEQLGTDIVVSSD